MKVWITKYALSVGIRSVEAELSERSPDMITVSTSRGVYTGFHGEGREWHRTWGEAVVRAMEMRDAKVASLRKQIAKLEKIEFVSPTKSEGET